MQSGEDAVSAIHREVFALDYVELVLGGVHPWHQHQLNIVVLNGKVGGFDEVDWNITTPDSPPCLGWVLILQTDRELSIGLEQVPRPTSGKMLGVLSSSSDHVLRFSIRRPMQCCLFDLKTYIRSCFRSSRGRVLVNIWWPTWSPFSCFTLSSLSSQSLLYQLCSSVCGVSERKKHMITRL